MGSGNNQDEVVIVKGTADNVASMQLELIRQTYNQYVEKVNENPKWTINMSAYCRDVHFLLNVVHHLMKELHDERSK